jgi:hypothetical protein
MDMNNLVHVVKLSIFELSHVDPLISKDITVDRFFRLICFVTFPSNRLLSACYSSS